MTTLKHGKGKCRGTLLVDVTGAIALLTPSYSLKPTGEFIVGISEFKERSKAKFTDIFVCSTCNATMSPESDDILSQCNVCRKDKPVSEMFVSSMVQQICESCVEILSDPSKKTDDLKIMEYRQFISLPDKTACVPMTKVMKSKFSL